MRCDSHLVKQLKSRRTLLDASLYGQGGHTTLDEEREAVLSEQERREINADGGERKRSRIRDDKIDVHGCTREKVRKENTERDRCGTLWYAFCASSPPAFSSNRSHQTCKWSI